MKVVIIGAGVAGLGIGWRLRQRGVDVTVLEQGEPAKGATWASAGMIAVAGELGGEETPETAFARHSRRLWPDFAAELEDAARTSISYLENGALIVALSWEEAVALNERSGLARLDVEEALMVEPMLTPDIAVALFAPGEAQVNSRALGDALAKAFVRAGGVIAANAPALRVEIENGRAIAVHTGAARYAADAFVLAAGAWSATREGIPRAALPPVSPVKGQMIALAPSDGVVLPDHVVWANGVYLVPRAPHLLVGATVENKGFDTALTRDAASWLFDRAQGAMPALKDWRVADHWAGLRPGSPDGLPILGPSQLDGLYVATGQYRNGILFAPAVAELLCAILLDASPAPAAFDPRRFA